MQKRLLVLAALLLAFAICGFDLLSPLEGAIAVLYVAVVLIVAPIGRRAVIVAGAGCAMLTLLAFTVGHLPRPADGALSRVAVSLVALTITTLLSLRDRSSRTTLTEQARILELTHDTVIIRDERDAIVYWNDGAERLYGWSKAEALGKNCQSLLDCSGPTSEAQEALERQGHWSGELTRARRDGTRLILATRWLLRRDADGRRIGVIESSADLTEQRRADAERAASEERYRTIFDVAGFATWEADWSATMQFILQMAPSDQRLQGWLEARPEVVQAAIAKAVIRNANQAAVNLFEARSRDALVGANLCGRYLPEDMPFFAQILALLAGGATVAESEVQLKTLQGRVADVVLRATVLPGGEAWSRMLIMAVDVTERNEARARLEQSSAELAHAGRVALLGQLAASITHEVNQPLTAIINYGKSGRRWLARPEPDLPEAIECLDKIVRNGTRASEVISRVRGLARKAAPQTEALNLLDLVEDSIALVQHEARGAKVFIRRRGAASLPPVAGDRVQLQQVLVNLLLNGVQAMREVASRRRELCVDVQVLGNQGVRIAVEDCGVGFSGDPVRIFEPFFTTKPDGMGMGLSICRAIIEAQGGKIMAQNNLGPGATVAFTVPALPASTPAQQLEVIS